MYTHNTAVTCDATVCRHSGSSSHARLASRHGYDKAILVVDYKSIDIQGVSLHLQCSKTEYQWLRGHIKQLLFQLDLNVS